MKFVADIADAEAGALADLVVFEVFVVFERDEMAVGGIEFGNEELQCAEGFEFAERLVGFGGVALKIIGGVDRCFAFVVAEVVECEVADGAEKPRARIGDVFPMRVEFEKNILHQVFGGFPLTHEAVSVAQQWRFLRRENLEKR